MPLPLGFENWMVYFMFPFVHILAHLPPMCTVPDIYQLSSTLSILVKNHQVLYYLTFTLPLNNPGNQS
jgi:hypothetical protein